jgi:hypothetical protein
MAWQIWRNGGIAGMAAEMAASEMKLRRQRIGEISAGAAKYVDQC